MTEQLELEQQLNSFDTKERAEALSQLVSSYSSDLPAASSNVNMHFHSFFSYNAEDYSPARIAWESRKAGLYAAGLCDFDVLDGLEEFIQAGITVGLRSTVNIETRAFVKEYADVDINSPGEAGVAYIMGSGFARQPEQGTEQAKGQAEYAQRAMTRNKALMERINPHLPDIALDYEKDVLSLTPSGNATERHIVRAYTNMARSVFGDPESVANFWSGVLGNSKEESLELLADTAALEDVVRSKLAKRGGVGYQEPSPESFPPVEDFINWVASCGAVPMVAWLDGTTNGEKDPVDLLERMSALGAVALNIIPDRNWNFSDPEAKASKTSNLNDVIKAAESMNLPVNIGTEMNKAGLPFFDDLAGECLKAHANTFLAGARIMVGHSTLLRYADFSYISEAANAEFSETKEKNNFFESAGSLPPITTDLAEKLENMGPEKALSEIRDMI